MKFCMECGEKLNSAVNFCIGCGTPVPISKAEDSNDQETPELNNKEVKTTESLHNSEKSNQADDANSQQTPAVKKPASKKSKIILGIVVGLALLLFIAHKGLSNYFDPMKDLVAMEEAISENKSGEFLSYIAFEKEALLDKKSYFEYIKEVEWDESAKDQYMTIIKNDKQDPNPLDKEITSISDYPLFKVKKTARIFGLYHEYTLHAIPTELELYSNVDATEVTIKDTKINIDQADEYIHGGKIYPGNYVIEAAANGEYGDFTFEDTIEIDAFDEDVIEIYFESVIYEVYTDYGFEDAILFIDNKSTKEEIGEVFEFGPIPENSNLKLYAEWKDEKGNVVRSNPVQLKELDGYTDVHFEFDETRAISADIAEQEGAEAGQFVLEFRGAYEEAVNYADFSEIESFLKKDSHADKDLRKFIKDMENGYYFYEFGENTITSVSKKDGDKFEVETNELFTFFDDDGKVYDYNRDKKYFVEMVDGNYQISKIEYTDTNKNNVG